MRYHPNWKASIDGVWQDTLRATPEYPAVFIKPGTHLVEFRYRQSTQQKIINLISFTTLLYVLAPMFILQSVKKGIKGVS
jgi:hypothetical protein